MGLVGYGHGHVGLDLRCEGFAEGFGGDVTVLPVSNDPTEVVSKVKAALDEAGIEIPFPYRTLTFKEPLAIAAPTSPGG